MSIYQAYSTFQPSPYSYGDLGRLSDEERRKLGMSAGSAGISAGGTLATAALTGGGASAAGGGAAAAGGTAAIAASGGSLAAGLATVPVAGWIAAGAVVTATGVIIGVTKRKINKRKALAWAKKLKLSEPDKVVGFVIKLSKKPRKWRQKKLKVYRKRMARLKKKRGLFPKMRKRRIGKLRQKIILIGELNKIVRKKRKAKRARAKAKREAATQAAIDKALEQQAAVAPPSTPRGSYPPSYPPPAASGDNFLTREVAGAPTWVWLVGATALVGGAVYMSRK